MKHIFLPLLLMLIVFKSYSQTKNFIDMPYVETTANVDTFVVPDKIYLSIIITEKDTKGKTSVEELEAKIETELKNIGINTTEKLSLYDLSSNFKKYFLKGQDVLKVKSYILIVEDALMAGKVIIALERINISNIAIEKTEYSEIEKLRLILKSKAILKAKLQAQSLAEPLNQKVGNAIFILDLSNKYVSNALQGRVAGIQIRGTSTINSKYKPADIKFEKIKVESAVEVKFKLE